MVDYQKGIEKMREYGIAPPVKRFLFAIPDAKAEMQRAMEAVGAELGVRLEWLPEYDAVAGWLSDNGGKGLLLQGNIGRGKSLLLKYILPLILNRFTSLSSWAKSPNCRRHWKK